jgi:cell pole-organizing protein PopZ
MGKLFSILGVGLLLVASSANAADTETAAAEEAPAADAAKEVDAKAEEAKAEVKAVASPETAGEVKYGSAGCGLGSILFGPGKGITQIFAATTNGTSATQTFGITSGTSNCDASAPSPKTAKVYVQTNRTALAKEIARGKGETISGLAELSGCRDSVAVGSSLQRQFKAIFPSAQVSDEQVSETVVDVLKSDASLACGNLS